MFIRQAIAVGRSSHRKFAGRNQYHVAQKRRAESGELIADGQKRQRKTPVDAPIHRSRSFPVTGFGELSRYSIHNVSPFARQVRTAFLLSSWFRHG